MRISIPDEIGTIRVWLSNKPYPEGDMDRPPDTVITASDVEPKLPLNLTEAWIYDAGVDIDDDEDFEAD